MSETDYPKEVTKDNVQQLKERATKIKKKAFQLMILTTVLYGIIGFIFLWYMFPFIGVSLLHALPDLSPATFWVIFLLVF